MAISALEMTRRWRVGARGARIWPKSNSLPSPQPPPKGEGFFLPPPSGRRVGDEGKPGSYYRPYPRGAGGPRLTRTKSVNYFRATLGLFRKDAVSSDFLIVPQQGEMR
ncbi:hypothetical protein CCP4SC76_2020015 [Gammaproteobacteria bacterium]